MPNVYKMPLLYSLNSNSYKDFFDPELEKILSKYSFFVSKSVKQGCLNSEYICTILKQAGITVIWFRLLGPFHFISCIIRENIRYYIDNETKSGFGVVYLRIEGDIIDTDKLQDQDLPILKQFYDSQQYTTYNNAINDYNWVGDIPDIINKFNSVNRFITPHIINKGIKSNGEVDNPEHPIPSVNSEILDNDGKYITINESLIDTHDFKSSAVISFDEYKCFTLSPRYNQVFNQFNTFIMKHYEELTESDIIDLLKLCLLIPDFKLQTYKLTMVEKYYGECANELKGGSRKKTKKRKINKRNSKNSKRKH